MTDGPALLRDEATAAAPTSGPSSTMASALTGLIDEARLVAAASGRDDLSASLGSLAERMARTDTVVCVVGEFKKGKSALINALLGTAVCPVDDDLATMTVTVVRHADTPTAVVRRREAGELVVETIPADEVGGWVAERDGQDAPDAASRSSRSVFRTRSWRRASPSWIRPGSAVSMRRTPRRRSRSCRRPMPSSS